MTKFKQWDVLIPIDIPEDIEDDFYFIKKHTYIVLSVRKKVYRMQAIDTKDTFIIPTEHIDASHTRSLSRLLAKL